MKKILAILIMALLLAWSMPVFSADNVDWYQSAGVYKGMTIRVPAGTSLPVAGSFTLTGGATEATLFSFWKEGVNPDSGFRVSPKTGATWNIGNWPTGFNVNNWPGSYPVTGTFWQATQPVSGTFWQATQPVSIASMPSTPVTGTFWQATQPVSGTVTVTGTVTSTPSGTQAVSNQALTDAQSNDSGIFTKPKSGQTWPVSNQTLTDGGSLDSGVVVRPATGATFPVSGSVTTSGTATVAGTVTAVQATLGALKTAASLYQTDGVPMDITHPIYVAPSTGASFGVIGAVTTSGTVTNIMADVTQSDTWSVDLVFADTTTVVSYTLPAKTVSYEFTTQGGTAVYWSNSSGGLTTNRWKQPAGIPYCTFQNGPEKLYSGTLYFQDATGADTLNIHVVTKP